MQMFCKGVLEAGVVIVIMVVTDCHALLAQKSQQQSAHSHLRARGADSVRSLSHLMGGKLTDLGVCKDKTALVARCYDQHVHHANARSA